MGAARQAGEVGQAPQLEGGGAGKGEATAHQRGFAAAQAEHFAQIVEAECLQRPLPAGLDQVGGQAGGLLEGHLGGGGPGAGRITAARALA